MSIESQTCSFAFKNNFHSFPAPFIKYTVGWILILTTSYINCQLFSLNILLCEKQLKIIVIKRQKKNTKILLAISCSLISFSQNVFPLWKKLKTTQALQSRPQRHKYISHFIFLWSLGNIERIFSKRGNFCYTEAVMFEKNLYCCMCRSKLCYPFVKEQKCIYHIQENWNGNFSMKKLGIFWLCFENFEIFNCLDCLSTENQCPKHKVKKNSPQ